MDRKDLLYTNGWSYRFNELGDFGFYIELTILRASEDSDDLIGVFLTRQYTIERSERFAITENGAHAKVSIAYYENMGAVVRMVFSWLERNPDQDIYRFNVDFELSVDRPAVKYSLQSVAGEFNLHEPPLPTLDGQMIQWFTTRAGIVDSEIFVVIDTMPSEAGELLRETFLDLAAPVEIVLLDAYHLSAQDLVTALFEADGNTETDLSAAAALLAQTQIVVSHSPLTVEPVASSLDRLAALGGTASLLIHPHLMPIAVISWAGLDIFVRVQRKGRDPVAQQAAQVTDRLFEMMHHVRQSGRKSQRARKGTQALTGEKRNTRGDEREA